MSDDQPVGFLNFRLVAHNTKDESKESSAMRIVEKHLEDFKLFLFNELGVYVEDEERKEIEQWQREHHAIQERRASKLAHDRDYHEQLFRSTQALDHADPGKDAFQIRLASNASNYAELLKIQTGYLFDDFMHHFAEDVNRTFKTFKEEFMLRTRSCLQFKIMRDVKFIIDEFFAAGNGRGGGGSDYDHDQFNDLDADLDLIRTGDDDDDEDGHHNNTIIGNKRNNARNTSCNNNSSNSRALKAAIQHSIQARLGNNNNNSYKNNHTRHRKEQQSEEEQLMRRIEKAKHDNELAALKQALHKEKSEKEQATRELEKMRKALLTSRQKYFQELFTLREQLYNCSKLSRSDITNAFRFINFDENGEDVEEHHSYKFKDQQQHVADSSNEVLALQKQLEQQQQRHRQALDALRQQLLQKDEQLAAAMKQKPSQQYSLGTKTNNDKHVSGRGGDGDQQQQEDEDEDEEEEEDEGDGDETGSRHTEASEYDALSYNDGDGDGDGGSGGDNDILSTAHSGNNKSSDHNGRWSRPRSGSGAASLLSTPPVATHGSAAAGSKSSNNGGVSGGTPTKLDFSEATSSSIKNSANSVKTTTSVSTTLTTATGSLTNTNRSSGSTKAKTNAITNTNNGTGTGSGSRGNNSSSLTEITTNDGSPAKSVTSENSKKDNKKPSPPPSSSSQTPPTGTGTGDTSAAEEKKAQQLLQKTIEELQDQLSAAKEREKKLQDANGQLQTKNFTLLTQLDEARRQLKIVTAEDNHNTSISSSRSKNTTMGPNEEDDNAIMEMNKCYMKIEDLETRLRVLTKKYIESEKLRNTYYLSLTKLGAAGVDLNNSEFEGLMQNPASAQIIDSMQQLQATVNHIASIEKTSGHKKPEQKKDTDFMRELKVYTRLQNRAKELYERVQSKLNELVRERQEAIERVLSAVTLLSATHPKEAGTLTMDYFGSSADISTILSAGSGGFGVYRLPVVEFQCQGMAMLPTMPPPPPPFNSGQNQQRRDHRATLSPIRRADSRFSNHAAAELLITHQYVSLANAPDHHHQQHHQQQESNDTMKNFNQFVDNIIHRDPAVKTVSFIDNGASNGASSGKRSNSGAAATETLKQQQQHHGGGGGGGGNGSLVSHGSIAERRNFIWKSSQRTISHSRSSSISNNADRDLDRSISTIDTSLESNTSADHMSELDETLSITEREYSRLSSSSSSPNLHPQAVPIQSRASSSHHNHQHNRISSIGTTRLPPATRYSMSRSASTMAMVTDHHWVTADDDDDEQQQLPPRPKSVSSFSVTVSNKRHNNQPQSSSAKTRNSSAIGFHHGHNHNNARSPTHHSDATSPHTGRSAVKPW